MKKKLSKKAKIIISSVGILVLVLGICAYWAADRFLIEHVKVDLNNVMPASDGEFPTSSIDEFPTSSIDDVQASPSIQVTPSGNTATPGESINVTPTGTSKVTPKQTLKVTSTGNAKATPTGASKAVVPTKGPEEIIITDTSYKSDSKAIKITKVVTGQGNDTVTYYVADIKLTKANQMKSAFAKNKYGDSIIQATSVIAKANDAILAINGDYYGFRRDGIVLRNGMVFRSEPSERTGLAFYKDGSAKIFSEMKTTGDELLKNGVWNTVSFGPALVVDGKVGADLDSYRVDFNIGSRPIDGLQPRTGIGYIGKNHFVFVVVDGRAEGYSKGMELTEFANVFKNLGCSLAYNLDGGYSSTMYFNGKLVNRPGNTEHERGTSDIYYIK